MARKSGELIPVGLRYAIKQALATTHTSDEIEELFAASGFEVPEDEFRFDAPNRVDLLDGLHRRISFADRNQAERYLAMVGRALNDLDHTQRSKRWGDPEAEGGQSRIVAELADAGIERANDGSWVLPDGIRLGRVDEFEAAIGIAARQLARHDAEPEELIGAGKDLVEGAIKGALRLLAVPFDEKGKIPDLAALLHDHLTTDATTLGPTKAAQNPALNMLRAVPQNIASIRNAVGTGHPHAGDRPPHRLGVFVAESAIVYARFISACLAELNAPWH